MLVQIQKKIVYLSNCNVFDRDELLEMDFIGCVSRGSQKPDSHVFGSETLNTAQVC